MGWGRAQSVPNVPHMPRVFLLHPPRTHVIMIENKVTCPVDAQPNHPHHFLQSRYKGTGVCGCVCVCDGCVGGCESVLDG